MSDRPMPRVSRFRALQPLPGVLLALVAAIVAYWVRYGFVEPEKMGAACETAGPWWCGPRAAFIVFTEWKGFGWIALATAALAALWFVRGRDPLLPALFAMAAGGAGMVLYNATLSTVAVIAAVVLLAQHRQKTS
jgi:hypothetical protein